MSLFEIIDSKSNCPLIYFNGDIVNIPLSDERLTHTFEYNSLLYDREIEYAKIYCNGKTLKDVCPESQKKQYESIVKLYRSHLISIREAKIDLNKNCLYDIVPYRILKLYYDMKSIITQYVFEHYKKPEQYEQLVSIVKVLEDIKKRKLNLNEDYRKILKLSHKKEDRVLYNALGSKTGRLTTLKGSFPIMNLKKGLRCLIKPNNDVFIEIDFNGAEIRTIMGLLGLQQPQYDIHEWNKNHIYNNEITREEAKRDVISWFYDIRKKSDKLDAVYKDARETLLKRYYDGNKIKTIYKREIECDEHHALNYIPQSTFASLFCEQVVKIHNLLREKESYITLLLHDNIVIDMVQEERYMLSQIIETFQNTRLGKFFVTVKIGKNFGEMKKINF